MGSLYLYLLLGDWNRYHRLVARNWWNVGLYTDLAEVTPIMNVSAVLVPYRETIYMAHLSRE